MKTAKVSTMAIGSNYNFPEANFLAQCQSGHSAIDLPGNTKSPPSITQQELNPVWHNLLLDGGLLHQEEEQSSSDDDNSNMYHQQGQPSGLSHPPL